MRDRCTVSRPVVTPDQVRGDDWGNRESCTASHPPPKPLPMRIAFMGSPPLAVPTLAALHAAGRDIAAVYTQPPCPAQRGKKLQQSAVQDRKSTRLNSSH